MRTASYQEFISKATLLLLDTPEHIQLGFDNLAINPGTKFKGIKLITLGPHYLHFSLTEENHMFKISQFILFTQTEKIKVLRWNLEAQDFLTVSKTEEASYIEAVKQLHFDCYLAPYENQKITTWQDTCNFINLKVLKKLDPVTNISTTNEQYGNKQNPKKQVMTIDEEDNIQQLQDVDIDVEGVSTKKQQQTKQSRNVANFKVIKGTIFYSQIPKKLKESHVNTTDINLDKTPILKHVLKNQYHNMSPLDILGQIQYSFVSFFLGQNLQSFDQWKKLVNLLCYSQKAVMQYIDLYLNFVVVLFNEIRQLPLDFFMDALSKDSFLVGCLTRLQEYSVDEKVNKKVGERLRKLFQMIRVNFKYQIPVQADDQMPTVFEECDYL